jgi:hypothetical protein
VTPHVDRMTDAELLRLADEYDAEADYRQRLAEETATRPRGVVTFRAWAQRCLEIVRARRAA